VCWPCEGEDSSASFEHWHLPDLTTTLVQGSCHRADTLLVINILDQFPAGPWPWVRPASCPMGISDRCVKLVAHLRLVPTLRMCGAEPPLLNFFLRLFLRGLEGFSENVLLNKLTPVWKRIHSHTPPMFVAERCQMVSTAS
jgi:hypothetical protein